MTSSIALRGPPDSEALLDVGSAEKGRAKNKLTESVSGAPEQIDTNLSTRDGLPEVSTNVWLRAIYGANLSAAERDLLCCILPYAWPGRGEFAISEQTIAARMDKTRWTVNATMQGLIEKGVIQTPTWVPARPSRSRVPNRCVMLTALLGELRDKARLSDEDLERLGVADLLGFPTRRETTHVGKPHTSEPDMLGKPSGPAGKTPHISRIQENQKEKGALIAEVAIPEAIKTADFERWWAKWPAHCAKLGHAMTAEQAEAQLDILAGMAPEAAVGEVKNAMARKQWTLFFREAPNGQQRAGRSAHRDAAVARERSDRSTGAEAADARGISKRTSKLSPRELRARVESIAGQ